VCREFDSTSQHQGTRRRNASWVSVSYLFMMTLWFSGVILDHASAVLAPLKGECHLPFRIRTFLMTVT
jgi:hypothetical protein